MKWIWKMSLRAKVFRGIFTRVQNIFRRLLNKLKLITFCFISNGKFVSFPENFFLNISDVWWDYIAEWISFSYLNLLSSMMNPFRTLALNVEWYTGRTVLRWTDLQNFHIGLLSSQVWSVESEKIKQATAEKATGKKMQKILQIPQLRRASSCVLCF